MGTASPHLCPAAMPSGFLRNEPGICAVSLLQVTRSRGWGMGSLQVPPLPEEGGYRAGSSYFQAVVLSESPLSSGFGHVWSG